MTVEAIIVLGIAAVCCILLTNRFNLIGPVLLIAAGAGASFIPGVSEASLSPTIVLTIFAIALSTADNGQSVTTSSVITQFVLSIGAGAGPRRRWGGSEGGGEGRESVSTCRSRW